MRRMKVGVIGCGNISPIYLQAGRVFETIDIVACADIDMERARARAAEFGVPKVLTPEELLADPEVEIVLNLTVPKAHAEINLKAIESGKHIYTEKPLATNREDGRKTVHAARAKGVRVGSAPDTFLGGGIQTCRKLIDDGWIGEPVGATAFMTCHGHESWHPSPEFYYEVGGGPMFDMGPYYLTALVNLIGPVRQVSGMARITFPERLITSQPKFGKVVKVETPTHIAGTMEFANGAIGTVVMSFDVWAAQLPRIEIYGTEGTLSVPDPNTFGGPVRLYRPGNRDWMEIPLTHGYTENSRGLGVADMAAAIQTGRPHRASGDLAYHVLDVMQAFLDAAEAGRTISIESTCERPKPLPLGLRHGQIDA